MYARALIKKRCYWKKGVHGGFIYHNFEDKDVGNVGIIEARTQDNKLSQIFCMKDPDYVINIMAGWVIINEV